ncbi:MAG: SsrA-binding protein SmpB [Candidatus Wildermuthbacteria bacterium]|nr:SsrA-binding protein SmpB [Candidatus Wildermuthbacteria bacterium]
MPHTFTENRKAFFDYEMLEKFQAGIVLTGQEVKSIKSGRVRLDGSYIVIRGKEPSWIGGYIPPYQPKNAPADYNPEQTRKLLQEISYLNGKVKERGLTLVPLKMYSIAGGMLKLEFGLAKGKKQYDKRESIKKRETEREMRRALNA